MDARGHLKSEGEEKIVPTCLLPLLAVPSQQHFMPDQRLIPTCEASLFWPLQTALRIQQMVSTAHSSEVQVTGLPHVCAELLTSRNSSFFLHGGSGSSQWLSGHYILWFHLAFFQLSHKIFCREYPLFKLLVWYCPPFRPRLVDTLYSPGRLLRFPSTMDYFRKEIKGVRLESQAYFPSRRLNWT